MKQHTRRIIEAFVQLNLAGRTCKLTIAMVGLPDSIVRESKVRVKTDALRNSSDHFQQVLVPSQQCVQSCSLGSPMEATRSPKR